MVVFWANVMNEHWQINNLISWKFLFITHKLILKAIPVRQVKSLRSRKMYILWFFFHADVKM